ncbi:alpha/beta hydrolase [Natronospora cellulosivora (SeqCode)]
MSRIKDININSDSKVINSSREILHKGKKNKAVLLLHGYTGSPREMAFLAKRVHQESNYTVYVPRLPGHGTNKRDFQQSTAKDWLRKSYDAYLNLKSYYNEVHIGGLSMGGLLAILTANRFKVEKLFLIAPALYACNKSLALTHLFKYFIPYLKNKSNKNEYQTEEELDLYENYWKHHCTKQAAELHKLMILARKKLTSITSDALIICSPIDKQVPIKAAYKVEEKISSTNKKLILMENSPHVINNGPEKEECAQHVIDFLNEV